MSITFRPVEQKDCDQLKKVLDSCGLFPSEYLDEMIAAYFSSDNTSDFWFTCLLNEVPVSIGYCVPEKLTDGTYNLLALGVHADEQEKGIAGRMMRYVEDHLCAKDGRLLIVETSSDDSQQAARHFYEKCGYTKTATIPDFWQNGEDKIVYLKRLI